ncbi:MAG: type II/IV secretion system protein [Puniceicoccaceae bacterium]|nr:MAG: type II/IV secretion system protein [Puniceicoccaceae bacterium]
MLKKLSLDFPARVRSAGSFSATTGFEELLREHGDTLVLLEAIIEQRILPKDEACRLYADSRGFSYVDPLGSLITDEATAALPAEIAQKANVVGLYILGGVLTAAFSQPENEALVKRISRIVQMPVSPVFAPPREIEDTILIQYSGEKSIEDQLSDLERSRLFDDPDLAADKLAMLADSESLVAILDEVIFFAIRERATDVHIEPQETLSRIRFRIDGMLREIVTYSSKLHRALISRLKIVSNLNISESRFPQDGRFSMPMGSATANFRVSCIPSQHGEKAVVRILAMAGRKTTFSLEKMMMSQTILRPFRRLIRNPSGIIFVTGPTGSGKTTTLFGALNEINTPDTNISTIEDPVEIQLPGVTQTQVNSNIDLKFATVLRSLLRQDPDVILVGEIRDAETAKIATEAALTGHTVFATLHTNSATQAIVRLLEIGVPSYMVAPSVMGVLAQRLAARICENCKEAYVPSKDTLRKYFKEEGLSEVHFFRGKGCSACRGTGYKGRVAFHELVLVTEEIRTLITRGASVQEITTAATKVGYRPLRYDGLKKVLLGLTTIQEIEANTSMEWGS